jgi:hypothetical protein
MQYLTPARFKQMGFGIDVSELDDAELLALERAATTAANLYCNVPRIPQMHDFRGGRIVDERHTWRYPVTPFEIGQRRFYPFHWPILSVESFRINVTNTQYVEIRPTELMINNTDRYFEVVSLALTSSGLFNALIIPNVGLATPVASTSYTYGWDFVENDETLANTDGQTWRAQNQFWLSGNDQYGVDRTPVIKKNGTVVTTGFTIDMTEGTVVFDDQLVASDTVTATYHYPLPSDIQFGVAQIMVWLHTEAEMHQRGMAHLNSLQIGEVKMQRPRVFPPPPGIAASLDLLVPEAAMYLSSFRSDHITVRA